MIAPYRETGFRHRSDSVCPPERRLLARAQCRQAEKYLLKQSCDYSRDAPIGPDSRRLATFDATRAGIRLRRQRPLRLSRPPNHAAGQQSAMLTRGGRSAVFDLARLRNTRVLHVRLSRVGASRTTGRRAAKRVFWLQACRCRRPICTRAGSRICPTPCLKLN